MIYTYHILSLNFNLVKEKTSLVIFDFSLFCTFYCQFIQLKGISKHLKENGFYSEGIWKIRVGCPFNITAQFIPLMRRADTEVLALPVNLCPCAVGG